MDVQGKNALANLLNGADPPSQGLLVKKDDDGGFDAALGMALFAHPSFVPPPNQITDGSRDRVATPDQASLLAGPSAVAGDNAPRVTDYGVRQSLAQDLAIDNGDTAGSRSAAAATASFEDFAASLPADGNAQLAARSGERQTSAIDLVAGGAPSPSAAVSVSLEGTSSSPASTGPADDPHGLPVGDPKPLVPQSDNHPRSTTDNVAADRFTSAAVSISLEGFSRSPASAEPADDPHGLPVGDPKPLDDPHGLPVADPKPLVPQANNSPQSTTGDAAASVPHEAGHAAARKAPADGALNLTVSVAPTARAGERASHAEGPAAPAFDGSQPKPAAARTNGPAAERGAAAPSADASGRQTASVSDAQGKSAPSNQIPDSRIPDSIDPPNRPTLSDDNKRGPASRTDSAQPASHRSGADNGIAPATMSVSDSGGSGASRPAAGPAPTLRTIATPAPAARVANLRIDLAAGQSTHATVRERSGAVDVRIVTANEQSAQLIGSEIPSLRRALDAAGMQLKTADVRHQGGGGERHQDERQQQPATDRRWQSGRSVDESIFAIEEVQ